MSDNLDRNNKKLRVLRLQIVLDFTRATLRFDKEAGDLIMENIMGVPASHILNRVSIYERDRSFVNRVYLFVRDELNNMLTGAQEIATMVSNNTSSYNDALARYATLMEKEIQSLESALGPTKLPE